MATPTFGHLNSPRGAVQSQNWVWDAGTLDWEPETQAGGGGGGAATIADGADVTQGAIADAAVVTDAAGTVSGKLRGLVKWAFERMPASLGQKAMAASLPVVVASDQSAIPISGTVNSTIIDGVDPTIKTTVREFAFLNALNVLLIDPVTGSHFDPIRVNPQGATGIQGTSPAFTGQIAASEFPCGGACGVVAFYLVDGGFDGEVRLVGGPDGIQAPIDLVYNATDNTVVSGALPFNKLLMAPVGGFNTVALYITVYNSGFFDFLIQAGPGTLNMPKGTQVVSAASLPLPTGAATLAEQQTQTTSLSVIDDWDESDRAKVNPIVGQAGVAAGTGVDGATVQRVTLATNVPLPAGTNNIGDVDVLSSALPTGASTSALQLPDGHNVTVDNAAGAAAVNIQDGGNTITVDGTVTANAGTGTFTTKETRAGTATTTQVADSATSVQLLALNADRLGATIQNDSSATLYLKLGTTASTTDYTVKIVTNAYYEIPYHYTGRIDGIWASDPGDGAARITELT